MCFTSKMYLGVSGYWQGIIDVHSPWGEGQGEGARV